MLCSIQFKMELRLGSVHCKFRRGKRHLPENALQGGQEQALQTSIRVNSAHLNVLVLMVPLRFVFKPHTK